jgi:hypothetical protein
MGGARDDEVVARHRHHTLNVGTAWAPLRDPASDLLDRTATTSSVRRFAPSLRHARIM